MGIREMLEHGRDELGGFGEPVWSQALFQYDLDMAELEHLRKLASALELYKAELTRVEQSNAELKADRYERETELKKLRDELNWVRAADYPAQTTDLQAMLEEVEEERDEYRELYKATDKNSRDWSVMISKLRIEAMSYRSELAKICNYNGAGLAATETLKAIARGALEITPSHLDYGQELHQGDPYDDAIERGRHELPVPRMPAVDK